MAQSQCHPRPDWLLSEARAVLQFLRGELTSSADLGDFRSWPYSEGTGCVR